MKLIGIDFGTKRVGIAVSDDTASVAFPRMTLPADKMLMTSVKDLIAAEQASEVIIGDSKDKDGRDNPVMEKARAFAAELERAGVTVRWEPEWYTSVEARREAPTSLVDANAAAIILNSYINRLKGTPDINDAT